MCANCGEELTGNKRKKYCSDKCRQLAAGRRYRLTDKGKAASTQARENHRFARRNTSKEEIKTELARQHFRCYGCMSGITLDNSYIDHDHKTGKVRGLLCFHCNVALGMVRDNPDTLRRLMAYLDRDRLKKMVYVSGSLRNDRVPEVAATLRELGIDVFDDWFAAGPEADDYWQKYEKQWRGHTLRHALKGRAAQHVATFDRSYIDMSDALVVILPAGRSTYLEAAYAWARGKQLIFFTDGHEPERYDVMAQLADIVVDSFDELVEALNG